MCQSARTVYVTKIEHQRFFFHFFIFILVCLVSHCPAIGDGGGGGCGQGEGVVVATEICMKRETYLDLIGDDGARAELCADLVCPDRIKVYETESVDVSVALHVLEVAQGGHITLIGVILPIKLHGDWARGVGRGHVCQLDRDR